MIIGVDVDEVVAQLHAPWLEWINDRWNLNVRQFNQWDIDKQIPEAGHEVYSFLCPRIYDEDIVRPFDRIWPALQRIRNNHFIVFVTSCVNGTDDSKYEWLKRHDIMREGMGDLFLSTHDKSDAPVDILVDDHIGNVRAFNGLSFLVNRSHNEREEWPLRVDSLAAFANQL